MMDFGFYNMDCLEGMKEFPDNYFDLAIVDPPYGDGLNRQETDNKELGVHFHGRGRSKKYQEVYAGKSETLENLGGWNRFGGRFDRYKIQTEGSNGQEEPGRKNTPKKL